MPVELVFMHGWGLTPGFWDALGKKLWQFRQSCIDLGFFPPRPLASVPQPITRNDTRYILIGHSYGFIDGLARRADWSGWVAINSFPRFVRTDAGDGCVAEADFRAMRLRLQSDPEKTLQDFYDMIGAARPEGAPNVEKLSEGLERLQSADASATLASLDVPGLILAGGKDPLVPMKASEALAYATRQGSMLVHPDGGHLLPQSDPGWCASAITDFLARFGET